MIYIIQLPIAYEESEWTFVRVSAEWNDVLEHVESALLLPVSTEGIIVGVAEDIEFRDGDWAETDFTSFVQPHHICPHPESWLDKDARKKVEALPAGFLERLLSEWNKRLPRYADVKKLIEEKRGD